MVAIGLRPDTASAAQDRLQRFSSAGRVLWTVLPSDRLSFVEGHYGPPWVTSNLTTLRAGGQSRIAWAVHHYTWWPSLLITLDERGNRLGTFVNSGWITQAIGAQDGRHILAVGMSNAHRSYFLAALDAQRPVGAPPEPSGSPTACRDCPPGGPLHYYVFPATDVSAQFTYPLGGPGLTLLPDGAIQAHVLESSGPAFAATIYEFGPDFRMGEVACERLVRRVAPQARIVSRPRPRARRLPPPPQPRSAPLDARGRVDHDQRPRQVGPARHS